jgi:hypothetical protein
MADADAASTEALAAVANGRGMLETEAQTSSQLVDLAAALESLPTEMARESGAAWEVVRRHLQRSGSHGPEHAGVSHCSCIISYLLLGFGFHI